ncbi:hypothetical protein KR093_004043 [Drosophila rubida]|uniref:Transcription factor Ouib n=1 Tax=Drosophila rubida TaxID=30044 RepID=A0AAD4JTI0_9MUSC|nr:hypothetical protein KR093_004043 [Drosophila rubida]
MVTTERVLDIASVCRVCLQDNDAHMVSIYDYDEEQRGISICDKIEHCCSIKVFCSLFGRSEVEMKLLFQIIRTPELPTRICLKCRAFLTLAHKFRQICRHSDDFLRKYIFPDPCEEDEKPCLQNELTQTYEQVEVEVLDEGAWCNDELIEEAPAVSAKAVPLESTTGLIVVSAAKSGKPHVCDICGNSYPRKSTLDTHLRRHNNEKPYQCEICHKTFHVNYQLMRHIRQHTGARPYCCQYCQRCFADRTSLVKHERIHRNERPYACNTCGKTFTYANVLKVHYKTHTGEKPHICKLCNKSFARNHNLVAHLQTQQHVNDPRCAAYLHTLRAASVVAVNEHG